MSPCLFLQWDIKKMKLDEYRKIIEDEPAVAEPLYNVVRSIPADRTKGVYSLLPEAAAVALLFPVVQYIIKNIGLPWLHETKRFSELGRIKFSGWIDSLYDKQGINPQLAEKAGTALIDELEKVTDDSSRKSWERFADLLKKTDRE